MKNAHPIDIVAVSLAVLGALSGVYSAAVGMGLPAALDLVFPGKSQYVMAIIGLVSICSAVILRVVTNKTPQNTATVPTTSGGSVTIATIQPPQGQPSK